MGTGLDDPAGTASQPGHWGVGQTHGGPGCWRGLWASILASLAPIFAWFTARSNVRHRTDFTVWSNHYGFC
jgi:hypothetical protein